jgi:hypothetical protein
MYLKVSKGQVPDNELKIRGEFAVVNILTKPTVLKGGII